ncbi:hypothetical protein VP468E531_P0080 [Vibrio phage 468E53-1]|nr:hypothetical protein VP468E531_P0080 [Vibrio phage 468E53-1]
MVLVVWCVICVTLWLLLYELTVVIIHWLA